MKGDFEKRRKKNSDSFEVYIPVDLREEVEKADNYCETNGISKSEQYMRGYLEQVRKLQEAEGIIVPSRVLQEHEDNMQEEIRVTALKNKLYKHMWSEYYQSIHQPNQTKHIDNVVKFAIDLGDEYLENLSRDEQFRLLPIFRILKAARIANKVTSNSLPTGEK